MIHPLCKDIIINLGINRFVETGTYLGETIVEVSKWFQELDHAFGKVDHYVTNEYLGSFPTGGFLYPVFKNSKDCNIKLWSVDVDFEKQNVLSPLFQTNPNIRFICKSSEQYLKELIDNGLITNEDKSFFYLDAHWGKYWPLRDEISQILRLKKSIIVIDDFVVPFHLGHEFDVYDGKVCGWYYIRGCFKKALTKNYIIYYPKFPNIGKRGTVIIFVGYSHDELKFMQKLPVFSPKLFKGDPFIEFFFGKVVFYSQKFLKVDLRYFS